MAELVDDVVSLPETDTVWPEFTDHSFIFKAMAPFGIISKKDLKLLSNNLLEKGIYSKDEKSLLVVVRTTPNLNQPKRAKLLTSYHEI